jgi:hypothetical protein
MLSMPFRNKIGRRFKHRLIDSTKVDGLIHKVLEIFVKINYHSITSQIVLYDARFGTLVGFPVGYDPLSGAVPPVLEAAATPPTGV